MKMHDLTTTALLAVLILLSGSMKIPSPVAGGEFQLSAPIAVLICALFGFKRYILAGVLASALGMMLGIHTIFSVIIQMSFRVVTGAVMALGGTNLLTVIISASHTLSTGSHSSSRYWITGAARVLASPSSVS